MELTDHIKDNSLIIDSYAVRDESWGSQIEMRYHYVSIPKLRGSFAEMTNAFLTHLKEKGVEIKKYRKNDKKRKATIEGIFGDDYLKLEFKIQSYHHDDRKDFIVDREVRSEFWSEFTTFVYYPSIKATIRAKGKDEEGQGDKGDKTLVNILLSYSMQPGKG